MRTQVPATQNCEQLIYEHYVSTQHCSRERLNKGVNCGGVLIHGMGFTFTGGRSVFLHGFLIWPEAEHGYLFCRVLDSRYESIHVAF